MAEKKALVVYAAAYGTTKAALADQDAIDQLPITEKVLDAAVINTPGRRQGHDLSAGLIAQEEGVLTRRRPPGTESSAVRRTRQHS
jgi:hypothetical protein